MATTPRNKMTRKKNVFPSKHPTVKNKDGSKSNVRLGVFSFGNVKNPKHVVLPTMVGGVQLSDDGAVKSARKHGITKFPSFATRVAANKWISVKHNKVK